MIRASMCACPPSGQAARRQPLRVVLDTRLRTPAERAPFCQRRRGVDPDGADDRGRRARRGLSARGARVETLPAVADRLDLPAVLERLGELEANEVLVEAGATLAGELLRESLCR